MARLLRYYSGAVTYGDYQTMSYNDLIALEVEAGLRGSNDDGR